MALWRHRNVEAHIWPLDHCPPHVTFVCRDGWTARMRFSMVEDSYVELWDIKPVDIPPPSSRLLNLLAHQLLDHLGACRAEWWRTQATVCLDNKDVKRAGAKRVRLCDRAHSQGRIVAGSGAYRQAATGACEVVANVRWTRDRVGKTLAAAQTTQDEKVEA